MVSFLKVCGVPDEALGPWIRAWERLAINQLKARREAAQTTPGSTRHADNETKIRLLEEQVSQLTKEKGELSQRLENSASSSPQTSAAGGLRTTVETLDRQAATLGRRRETLRQRGKMHHQLAEGARPRGRKTLGQWVGDAPPTRQDALSIDQATLTKRQAAFLIRQDALSRQRPTILKQDAEVRKPQDDHPTVTPRRTEIERGCHDQLPTSRDGRGTPTAAPWIQRGTIVSQPRTICTIAFGSFFRCAHAAPLKMISVGSTGCRTTSRWSGLCGHGHAVDRDVHLRRVDLAAAGRLERERAREDLAADGVDARLERLLELRRRRGLRRVDLEVAEVRAPSAFSFGLQPSGPCRPPARGCRGSSGRSSPSVRRGRRRRR